MKGRIGCLLVTLLALGAILLFWSVCNDGPEETGWPPHSDQLFYWLRFGGACLCAGLVIMHWQISTYMPEFDTEYYSGFGGWLLGVLLSGGGFVLVVCVICVAILLPGSSDQRIADNARLYFAASDRHLDEKTVFVVTFSTAGKTIRPGGRCSFPILFVDGKEEPVPAPSANQYFDMTTRIRPEDIYQYSWWMTLQDLIDWIGTGEHELQIQFRNVKSNVLKVTVPTETREVRKKPFVGNTYRTYTIPTGRVVCLPEREHPLPEFIHDLAEHGRSSYSWYSRVVTSVSQNAN